MRSPGAGAFPGIYQTLLNHIASHGFVVISYNSTAQGPELQTAMDWITSESMRQGSDDYNKVDPSKIAAGGQSAGLLAAFAIAKDPRLTTTLHINGGTFICNTNEMNLVKIALFICGDDPATTGGDGTWQGDEARPNCDADFHLATTPVWYGDVIGASHTTIIDNPLDTSATSDPLKKPFLAGERGVAALAAGWRRYDEELVRRSELRLLHADLDLDGAAEESSVSRSPRGAAQTCRDCAVGRAGTQSRDVLGRAFASSRRLGVLTLVACQRAAPTHKPRRRFPTRTTSPCRSKARCRSRRWSPKNC